MKLSNAINFILFALITFSGFSFIGNSFETGKYQYIIYALLIYLLSFTLRKFVYNNKSEKPGEVVLFFSSAVFILYLLNFFKIDSSAFGFMPEELFLQSAGAFTLLLIFQLIPRKSSLNFFIFIAVTITFYVAQDRVENILAQYSWIVMIAIGSPFAYVLFALFIPEKVFEKIDSRLRR